MSGMRWIHSKVVGHRRQTQYETSELKVIFAFIIL